MLCRITLLLELPTWLLGVLKLLHKGLKLRIARLKLAASCAQIGIESIATETEAHEILPVFTQPLVLVFSSRKPL
ncbi:hypothetical protein D3C80_1947180 [compost metagenome]